MENTSIDKLKLSRSWRTAVQRHRAVDGYAVPRYLRRSEAISCIFIRRNDYWNEEWCPRKSCDKVKPAIERPTKQHHQCQRTTESGSPRVLIDNQWHILCRITGINTLRSRPSRIRSHPAALVTTTAPGHLAVESLRLLHPSLATDMSLHPCHRCSNQV